MIVLHSIEELESPRSLELFERIWLNDLLDTESSKREADLIELSQHFVNIFLELVFIDLVVSNKSEKSVFEISDHFFILFELGFIEVHFSYSSVEFQVIDVHTVELTLQLEFQSSIRYIFKKLLYFFQVVTAYLSHILKSR